MLVLTFDFETLRIFLVQALNFERLTLAASWHWHGSLAFIDMTYIVLAKQNQCNLNPPQLSCGFKRF